MNKIEEIISLIEENLVEIKSETEIVKEKGFTYTRAKNIRKAAQQIKITAQDLRIVTSKEFKAVKK